MASIEIFHVDAFSDAVFGGNPAAVCPLEAWLPDEMMQAVAAENNLSETAFFCPEGDDFAIRWFTPTVEVDLCGHATLATGFVLLEQLRRAEAAVRLRSRHHGTLVVARDGDRFALDFPALPARPRERFPALEAALGAPPNELFEAEGGRVMALYDAAERVEVLAPDWSALREVADKVIVTAPGRRPGNGEDFVSRFFAPGVGVDEDPATGSAHCVLTPFWAQRLERSELVGRQLSRRGATLWCRDEGTRVRIAGHAVLYLRGAITIPTAGV